MSPLKIDHDHAALLLIDPYNDFASEEGKAWDRLKGVAGANHSVPHMVELLDAARRTNLRVAYALHRRYRPGDYEWKYIAPIQERTRTSRIFEAGSWGGEIRAELAPRLGDITASEHWCSSGFANTDLDVLLKAHGIRELVIAGFIANTCVEATARFAAELGYGVTVARDAVAAFSDEQMHVALNVNLPNYARIVTTAEARAAM